MPTSGPSLMLTVPAIALALAALVDAPAAEAATCKGVRQGQSSAPASLSAAKANARALWANSVASSYGSIWANWSYAKNRSYDCRPMHKQVSCRAIARPCIASPGGLTR